MRTQRGQLIETETSFSVRYYVDQPDGTRKQQSKLLTKKSEDVLPLMARVMENINQDVELLTGRVTLGEFFSECYLPWTKETKAASTTDCYRKLFRKFAPLARVPLADLDTPAITKFLTRLANNGLGATSIHHTKWLLSGIFGYAVAVGVVPVNPVPQAKALVRAERKDPPAVYSLDTVLKMIAVLEPVNLQAAAFLHVPQSKILAVLIPLQRAGHVKRLEGGVWDLIRK